MGVNSITPPRQKAQIQKTWPNLGGKCDPEVERAIRNLYTSTNDHNEAIVNLKGQVDKNAATVPGTSKAAPIQTASPASSPSGNYVPRATVNNQAGTSYTLQGADLAGLVTLTAPTTAVGLNSSVAGGFYASIENMGTGVATLTPTMGTVNELASIALGSGGGCAVFFDGLNWWAVTNFVPVASVFGRLGAVVAAAGDYTAAQVTGAEASANKGAANGYAPLNAASVVPSANLPGGYTGTIATAKLTTAGVNGSMTFTQGILTAMVAAT